jgi:hypothetical protein
VPTKLELKGLTEFRKALQNLPEDLREEADVIVQAQADEALRQIQAVYPVRTTNLSPGPRRKTRFFPPGNLRARVTRSREERSRFTSRAIVRSRAPHAHLFEEGTKRRKNAKGANRGAMPQAPIGQRMIPIVIRRRRVMVEALKDVVRKAGFQVNE